MIWWLLIWWLLGTGRAPTPPVPSSPPVAISTPFPQPVDPPVVSPPPGSAPDPFERLAQCESSGDPTARSGSYYGLFQFDLSTWRGAVTRAGFPEWAERLPTDASPAVQRAAAVQLHGERGWQPWPGCSRKLGLG